MKKLISVYYDNTPFRPQIIQMKLFLWHVAGSQFFVIEVSLRTKNKTFIRPLYDLSEKIDKNKTFLIAYKCKNGNKTPAWAPC